MTYGTLRPCGVVVCDDMDKGVVVYYDMGHYGHVVVCDDIWDTTDMWCSGLL